MCLRTMILNRFCCMLKLVAICHFFFFFSAKFFFFFFFFFFFTDALIVTTWMVRWKQRLVYPEVIPTTPKSFSLLLLQVLNVVPTKQDWRPRYWLSMWRWKNCNTIFFYFINLNFFLNFFFFFVTPFWTVLGSIVFMIPRLSGSLKRNIRKYLEFEEKFYLWKKKKKLFFIYFMY